MKIKSERPLKKNLEHFQFERTRIYTLNEIKINVVHTFINFLVTIKKNERAQKNKTDNCSHSQGSRNVRSFSSLENFI